MSKHTCDIVIFHADFPECQKLLEYLGLTNGNDFILLDTVEKMNGQFNPDERQLLIVGAADGSANEIKNLVSRLRGQYPKLVCMALSTNALREPFNGTIINGQHAVRNLFDAVINFMNFVDEKDSAQDDAAYWMPLPAQTHAESRQSWWSEK